MFPPVKTPDVLHSTQAEMDEAVRRMTSRGKSPLIKDKVGDPATTHPDVNAKDTPTGPPTDISKPPSAADKHTKTDKPESGADALTDLERAKDKRGTEAKATTLTTDSEGKTAMDKLVDKGLVDAELSDHFKGQVFGTYQMVISGEDKEYTGILNNGKPVQIDGFGTAPKGKHENKVILIEAKHSKLDLEHLAESPHAKYWTEKAKQMNKLATFAKENKEEIGYVEVHCSNQAAAEIYHNIIEQQVPKGLRKYIVVVLSDVGI